MHDLSIEISGDAATGGAFRPGEPIEGTFRWSIDLGEPVETIELSLMWQTYGRGDGDEGIADRLTVEHPPHGGERAFCFTAPPGPYSFSGKLIRLIWGLTLVTLPDRKVVQVPITISPTGHELLLHAPAPAAGYTPPHG